MNKLLVVVGASGSGKTTLVNALNETGLFETALEDHANRPFQKRFKQDSKYALANQVDYLLHRAEQEQKLRRCDKPGLMDGGLDLDFHGFTRLFHARGWLLDDEFDVCRRFYTLTRRLLPPPDLIIALTTAPQVIRIRLASRDRINIASAEDTQAFDHFLRDWLDTLEQDRILRLDVTHEGLDYAHSLRTILKRIGDE